MSRRTLLILLLAVVLSYACYLRGEQNPFARYASEGLETVQKDALDAVSGRELFDGAMRGMVGVLRKHGDQHSEYQNEAEASRLRSEIHQQFGGIGVRIGFLGEKHRLAIVAPPDLDTPAARAKLQPGDFILAINDQSTDGIEMAEVLKLVRGKPGTALRLKIESPSQPEPRTVELVREVINTESVMGDRRDKDGSWQFRLERDPQIALVRITSFGDRTAAEFANVMSKLTADGVRAIVLDLRYNPGGSLEAAVAVCQMMLPADKIIVETRGRGQVLLHRYVSTADGRYANLPLAVLVDQNSASAAEIVAACLQDHGRAIVIGQRSYGKGTVQQLLPVESGKSLLKLTWASFWRPSGANIHRAVGVPEDANWGVSPDPGHESKLSPEEYKTYLAYREKRDGFGHIDEKDADSTDRDLAAKVTGFVDKPLQLAVEYLQNKLNAQR
jgi:carboxyl-terminal processing protease